jgi:uncharacterized protein
VRSIEAEDIARRMRAENPWWATADQAVSAAWRFRPRTYFELFLPLVQDRSVKRAVVLLGPRRVGKTVLVHQAAQRLIAGGVPSKAVCYVSIDNPIYNELGIADLLAHLSGAAELDITRNSSFVFIDEIQYLKDWERHLKSAVDTYPTVKFVVSGSAAAALRMKSSESGAGRFTDFLLPPLTFPEFLSLLEKDQLIVPPQKGSSWFGATNIGELNQQFLDYVNFGGYPEALFSENVRADPGRFIKSDIIDKVLLRDLPSLYGIGDIQELNHLFTTLAFNTAAEVSLEELSKKSGVAKNTIKRYIEYLEAAFLIKAVHRVDRGARRFKRATHFKVYLTNASTRAALFAPVTEDDSDLEHLAETAIFSQWFHSQSANLFYARWDKGEVDMVCLKADQDPFWATEVKWSDRYFDRPHELTGLIQFCTDNDLHDVVVTTKTLSGEKTISGVHIDFVPVSIYCYTVAYNLLRGRERGDTDLSEIRAQMDLPLVGKERAAEESKRGSGSRGEDSERS